MTVSVAMSILSKLTEPLLFIRELLGKRSKKGCFGMHTILTAYKNNVTTSSGFFVITL